MYIPGVVAESRCESPEFYFQSARKTNSYYSVSEPLITGSHENGFETVNQFIGLRIQHAHSVSQTMFFIFCLG